jgi:GWxTD domain-containing protein
LRSGLSKCLLLLPVVLLITSLPLHAVDSVKNLPPLYRHWIEEEVPYIIQTEERKEFLALKSDAERDNFIKVFWDIRNPDPGSEINEYKEEHYRRLAYVNATFGNIKAQDGWRTDMGRIYITLGPPEQRANYPNARNVRPMVIWFYQSKTPALPMHFYILFYKRSMGEDYTIYSPYQDGPSRLVTGLEGKNEQKNNLDILKRSLGNEVARTALSLIPTEPVSLDDYTPSLQSDVMLATIRSLPDNALEKERLAERRAARESVTTSVFLNTNSATAQTAIFRDATGRIAANSLIVYDRPEQAVIGTLPDQKLGYSLTLQTAVLTADGKQAIYQQNDKLIGAIDEEQAKDLRTKRFGAETRVPLAPGQYQIVYTLTNDLTHYAVRQRVSIKVPDPSRATWTFSNILAFSSKPAVRDPEGKLPFSVAGIRFEPRGVQQAMLRPGEPLHLVFQLWTKPAAPASREGQKIKLHYVLGSVQSGAEPHQEDEEIDASSFDESGTLVTGRTLSTENLEPGNYRVVITAVDEASQQKAFATLNLRIINEAVTSDLWTAYDASEGSGRGLAIDDYKRALTAMMSGNNDAAISWLQRSVADDQTYLPALDRLIAMLSQNNRFKEVADLTAAHPIPHEVSPQTAILISEARAQTGDLKGASSLLEQELQFQAPTADLYLALASIYEKQGNASKAEDYKQRAAKLTN